MTDVGMPKPPRQPQSDAIPASTPEETRSGTKRQGTVQAAQKSFFLFHVTTPFEHLGIGREGFWNGVRDWPQPPGISPDKKPTDDELERAVKNMFAGFLKVRFDEFLKAFPPASDETNRKRETAMASLRFSVSSVGYGSLDIMAVIENLDKIYEPFGLALDTVTAVLSASAPGALNSTFEPLYGETLWVAWDVKGEALGERGPATPPQRTQEPAPERKGLRALLAEREFQIRLLNALYIVPIGVTLYVFVSTSLEMNKRIEAYDKDLLAVKTDEIARAAERTKLLDAQEKDRRERVETIYKENADAIRSLLSDEIKRAAARSDYFDQQQVLLLQRYENLSKDSSETIKALAQKAGSSSKSPTSEDRATKDVPSKPTDSK